MTIDLSTDSSTNLCNKLHLQLIEKREAKKAKRKFKMNGSLAMTESEIRSDLKEMMNLIHQIKLDVEILKEKEKLREDHAKSLDSYRKTIMTAIVIWVIQTATVMVIQILPKLQTLWNVTP